jgi:hypothetical protein
MHSLNGIFKIPTSPNWRCSSAELSFLEIQFKIGLFKKEGEVNYSCYLYSVETLSKPGKFTPIFNLLKKLDNTITLASQL